MKPLTAEQTVLLQLIRAALTDTPVELSSEAVIDWRAVAKEAAQQAVSLLAFDSAAKVAKHIPADVYARWTSLALSAMTKDARIGGIQHELTNILSENGYAYVILKGAASAAYYPKAELRTQGDVDFLINPTQSEEILALLRQNGYVAEDIPSDHHTVLKKAGVVLEMHFCEPAIPQGHIGDKIRAFLQDNIHTPQTLNNGTHDFYAPSDARHGLILLLHSQHHMLSEGLGLRHLCDWACFVQKTAANPFWEDLIPFIKEIGLYTYTSVITQVCAIYFGTPLPDWVTSAERSLVADLMEDVLTGGNFGKKDLKRARSGMMITHSGSNDTKHSRLYYLYHTLINAVKMMYPSVNRFPVLYPVFAIKIIVQYTLKVARGERLPIGELASAANERRSVYHKLHIFEVEKL